MGRALGALTLGALSAAAVGGVPTATIVLGTAVAIDPLDSEAIAPISVSIQDLNGDGLPDLVVGLSSSSGPIVYINDGSATPFSQSTRSVLSGDVPSYTTVADINGDGRPDLVVSGTQIFLNKGGPAPFNGVQGFRIGGIQGKGAVGDVNGDGFADVAVIAGGTNTLYLTHGAPVTSGGYSTMQFASAAGYAQDIKIADVNGDGKPDLLLANAASDIDEPSGVFVYLNNGTSSPFGGAPVQLLTGRDVFAITLVDVNQDGQLDLVAAGADRIVDTPQKLSVMLNTGSKTQPFGSPLALQPDGNVGIVCTGVSAADLNGNGLPDLLFACLSSGQSAATAAGVIYLNNGTSKPFAGAVPIDIPGTGGYGGPGGTAVAAGPFAKGGSANVLIGSDNAEAPLIEYPALPQAAPVASNEPVSCAAVNTSCAINVLSTDRAIPGVGLNPGSLTIVSGPAHGTITINTTSGVVTYRAVAGYSGADSFQYVVSDRAGHVSNVATISVNVQPAPVAVNDTVTIANGPSVTLDVLANDTSQRGTLDPTTLKIISPPAHGTAIVNAGLAFYTTTVGYSGIDSFKYTVEDNLGTVSNVATASIIVPSPATSYVTVDLSSYFDIDAIASPGQPAASGGLDGNGYAYSSSLLGPTVNWNGELFKLGSANAVDSLSGTPPGYLDLIVPPARYSKIRILATATNGAQLNQQMVFDYYDTFTDDSGGTQTVTQSFSDWRKPQNFPGESIVSTMPKRVTPTGALQPGPWYLYGYTIPVDPSRTLLDMSFLVDRDVVILAVDLDPPATPTAVPVDISGDTDAIRSTSSSLADPVGLDNLGNDYAGELLGNYLIWSGIPFGFEAPFGLAAIEQPLPSGYYSQLYLLATGYKGAQLNEPLVITYTDGSRQTVLQSFSDWGAPQHFPGESIVKTMAYRYTAGGLTKQPGPWILYGYTITLDKTKVVSSITLPDAHVTALALTLLP
jgi:hypothetical protein